MSQTSKRRESILNRLNLNGSVSVGELSELHDVSLVTIRNDLDYLDEKGLLIRSHGGAIRNQSSLAESSNKIKLTHHAPEKMIIAKEAVKQIEPKDAIILGAGTTTEYIAKLIAEESDLTVMTNGLNIVTALSASPGLDVMITGGTLRCDSQSFYGPQAEASLKDYHFDKIFVGVDGIHMDHGITTHSEHEARLYRFMCESIKKTIVVTDSSKFGKVSVYKVIPCSTVDVLITDSGISEEHKQSLIDQNVEVIIV
ncbi:transcriptional repressor AgaR [Vibrio nigripulchritudo]|uniref:transcriptional repressor AgaR n=1 Tax=Vibrio nigripulchritudo TaxID=28173 RepID=UPI002493696C|nr:transcriptional repressor AgaR [Vibrio nigripulchritudo]BDU40009.1 DeoR family transcriptional regulator [Vibrio nigripulchritudo]BDU45733.1 DeoR family transcriptional regulator [Vibrio nigripulchritudo]